MGGQHGLSCLPCDALLGHPKGFQPQRPCEPVGRLGPEAERPGLELPNRGGGRRFQGSLDHRAADVAAPVLHATSLEHIGGHVEIAGDLLGDHLPA